MPRGGPRKGAGRPALLDTEIGALRATALFIVLHSDEAKDARYRRWLRSQPKGKANIEALEQLREQQAYLNMPLKERPVLVDSPEKTLEDIRSEIEMGNIRRSGVIPAPNRPEMTKIYRTAATKVAAMTNRPCSPRQIEKAGAAVLATEGAKDVIERALFELGYF